MNDSELKRLYVDGISVLQLSKIATRSRDWVQRRLVAQGVALRSRSESKTTHGKAGNHAKGVRPDPIYKVWTSIKERTTNPNHRAFKDYGGRGIKMCERWQNSFEAFAADMGPRPDGFYIDRTDNDKGYSPDNCNWVTPADSTRNRRNAMMIDIEGTRMHLASACEHFNVVSYGTAKARIRNGWNPVVAVQTPPGQAPADHFQSVTQLPPIRDLPSSPDDLA